MNRYLKIALAAAAVAAAGSAAAAGSVSTTLPVSATVATNCLVGVPPALAFGTYAPGSGDLPGTTTISVRCTLGLPFNVGLNAGTGGGTIAVRRMINGAAFLNYTLWSDSGHNTNWGNTPTVDTVAGTGAGMGVPNTQTLTVYGLIPDSGSNLLASVTGTYSDSVTVTVNW